MEPRRRLLRPEDDHAVGEIIRGQGNRHTVTQEDADAEFTHAATQLSPDGVSALELDFELTPCVDLTDHTLDLDVVIPLLSRPFETPSGLASSSHVGSSLSVPSSERPPLPAAAASTPATAATATAAGAFARLIHRECPAIQLRAVHFFDRLVRSTRIGKGHEAEASRTPRVTVHDHLAVLDCAKPLEGSP
jgi:hypothetical protein